MNIKLVAVIKMIIVQAINVYYRFLVRACVCMYVSLSQFITCGIYFCYNNSVTICGAYVLEQAFIMVNVSLAIADT